MSIRNRKLYFFTEKVRGLLRSEKNGQMTIYLTMMFAVLLPLILMMIEGARNSASKVALECTTDMGMDSCLAEYHKELLDRYGLLFIDTAYGEAEGSLDNTKQHLLSYMSYNLEPSKGLLLFSSRDPLKLSCDSVDFITVARATDERGRVFRYMALSHMLERYGISYLSSLVDTRTNFSLFSNSLNGKNRDPLASFRSAKNSVGSISVTKPEDAGEDWVAPAKDNPTSRIASITESGILNILGVTNVSGMSFTPSAYASGRMNVVGDGLLENWENRESVTYALLFDRYLMTNFSNYRMPRDESVLSYELEYIIAGKSSDVENLKNIAWQLLGIRGVMNAIVFQASNMPAQADAAAAVLSFVTFMPSAKSAYKALISAGWILAESVCDVRLLFKGEKVPLDKKAGEWNLSLSNALSMNFSGHGCNRGLSYEEFLELMLLEVSLDERTERAMDMVEMDIRAITGQDNFRLDNCIAGGVLQFIFSSEYGYSYLMSRSFGYD